MSRPRSSNAATTMHPAFSARWLRLAAAIAMAGLWAPAVVDLARAWRADTYAGHGMFVPLFSAVVAWIDRGRLRAAAGPGNPAGVSVILAGGALLVLGAWSDSLLVKGLSITVAVAGVVLWSFGAPCLRAAAFPVAFLLLMAPPPHAVVAVVTLKLQLFAAAFAVSVLRQLDLAVHQSGLLIELPTLTLRVAEVCNGLRFLMALLVLTAAFAQVTQRSVPRKIVLVAAAIPIAIVANAMRVAAIALGVHWIGPEAASGTIHNWIGKGMWAATLIPLIGLGFLLARGGARKVSRFAGDIA
jgi:exosortase